jgi:hypothetical protein
VIVRLQRFNSSASDSKRHHLGVLGEGGGGLQGANCAGGGGVLKRMGQGAGGAGMELH